MLYRNHHILRNTCFEMSRLYFFISLRFVEMHNSSDQVRTVRTVAYSSSIVCGFEYSLCVCATALAGLPPHLPDCHRTCRAATGLPPHLPVSEANVGV